MRTSFKKQKNFKNLWPGGEAGLMRDPNAFDLGGDACLDARELLIALLQPKGKHAGVNDDSNLK